jgi:hypothetical protein
MLQAMKKEFISLSAMLLNLAFAQISARAG